MRRICLLLATLCLSAMFSMPAAAQAWTQIGTLSCRVDPNIGLIIVGHQPMQCVYTQAPGALPQVPSQSYDGALNTIGLSIGFSAGSICADNRGTGRRFGRRICGRVGRCRHRPGCRREYPAWRLEPHHRAAAAFASGICCRERYCRRVVAQAALAVVNWRSARPARIAPADQLRFSVIEAFTICPAPCESMSTLCRLLRVTMTRSAAKPALSM